MKKAKRKAREFYVCYEHQFVGNAQARFMLSGLYGQRSHRLRRAHTHDVPCPLIRVVERLPRGKK